VDATTQIERSLARSLEIPRGFGEPPLLVAAMRYAVFPGGARIRPRLCLAVARACVMGPPPPLCVAAAVAIELMHCASLVHDDLPCFDDAAVRRGRPSVHRAFDERIALLAGDALIVLAFQALARAAIGAPSKLGKVISIVARAVGAPGGIIAGQAWECEPQIQLSSYQRAKTGALFAGAAAAGASAAGYDGRCWYALGERLGEAYQIADDIRDVVSAPAEIGKPTGRDQALGRPNAVLQLGMATAVERLESLVEAAVENIPDCPGADDLRAHIRGEATRLLPRELARPAA
jgi:geranylgeranyl diphosphate synthase, type II